VKYVLCVLNDRERIEVERSIGQPGNDPRHHGSHVMSDIDAYVGHEEHYEQSDHNGFAAPYEEAVTNSARWVIGWLFGQGRVAPSPIICAGDEILCWQPGYGRLLLGSRLRRTIRCIDRLPSRVTATGTTRLRRALLRIVLIFPRFVNGHGYAHPYE
jgi:hypothetical protein